MADWIHALNPREDTLDVGSFDKETLRRLAEEEPREEHGNPTSPAWSP